MDLNDLRREYEALAPVAERLRVAFSEQVARLLAIDGTTPGVPIEGRVKSWDSIAEKVERQALALRSVRELQDLVGLRVILLFRRDLEKACSALTSTFSIVSVEDTSQRLGEAQFGYQSFHYVVKIPDNWLSVPSYRDFGELQAEVQLRTLAQHIWAAASHKLQYKHEQSVPVPIRRAIHRVSALLETADLEFERVLTERAQYLLEAAARNTGAPLNVDLLSQVLDNTLPAKNKSSEEPYAALLQDLVEFGIDTKGKLSDIIGKHLTAALRNDRKQVETHQTSGDYGGTSKERIDRGVFYTHVGLGREVLHLEFGKRFMNHLMTQAQQGRRTSRGRRPSR